MLNLTKSLDYLNRAKEIIPVATQTFSKGYRYFPEGAYPVYLKRGEGSHVWDVDNNEYIDFIMALCPITLGYSYPQVNAAIWEQLKDGIIFSLPHPLEIELSEILTGIIPCAEMVRFTKTGSEATQAAIRAARAYTRRNKILFRGYHGWHEWYSIASDRTKGIPKEYKNYIYQFEYNDINSLQKLFEEHGSDVAAVIMEPVIIEPPKNNFLEKVRDITHKYGALLIFDEIVTGFRIALGGAQEYFNVIPDLCAFGKGMANGMPMGAIAGRKDIMREFEDIFVSSTFGGECLSLAASIAVIDEMLTKNTIQYCWKIGEELQTGLAQIPGIEIRGYPCRPAIITDFTPEEKALLLQILAENGIIVHSNLVFNLCYSHTISDIAKTVTVFSHAMDIVKTGKVEELLKGKIVQPAFRRL